MNEWQQFDFPVAATFRHFCIETLSSYTDDNQACISEVELLDDKGQVIDKTKWKVVYVDSELADQNLGRTYTTEMFRPSGIRTRQRKLLIRIRS